MKSKEIIQALRTEYLFSIFEAGYLLCREVRIKTPKYDATAKQYVRNEFNKWMEEGEIKQTT